MTWSCTTYAQRQRRALLVAGAAWAGSPREAGAGREVVITMLPTPRHVADVLLGPDGLLDGLAPGAVWVDMSTGVPEVAERVMAVAGPRQVAVVDAPVSGMAAGAQAGSLQIFVGGAAADYQRIRPLLEAMGDPARILQSVLERGDYDDSFALALACKDLGLAVDLARQAGVPAEVSALVEQIYRRARAQYGDDGGEMLPIKLLEDLTTTPLRLPQE